MKYFVSYVAKYTVESVKERENFNSRKEKNIIYFIYKKKMLTRKYVFKKTKFN